MSDIAQYVGRKIKELRESKGLTQSDLARKVKVTPNTVSRWEGGTYRPSIEQIDRLSSALEKPIWAFFPADVVPPTQSQEALLSATGDLPREDLEELIQYAELVRARKALQPTKRGKKGP